jgi:hypothetical protein
MPVSPGPRAKSGCRINLFHWSRSVSLAILLFCSTAAIIEGLSLGQEAASWAAMVVKNWVAWLLSVVPLEKKKLAPSCFLSW